MAKFTKRYQLAYPVRWSVLTTPSLTVFAKSRIDAKTSRIETQDLILGRYPNVQRYIEIGPSKVLSTMAERTLNRKFLAQDRFRVLNRQLLSNSTDTKAICYEYGDTNDAMGQKCEPVLMPLTNQTQLRKSDESEPARLTVSPPVQPANDQLGALPANKSPSVTSGSIKDVPLSAKDIALALIAQKFKQPMDELRVEKTIRDLSGGKSSIFNCS